MKQKKGREGHNKELTKKNYDIVTVFVLLDSRDDIKTKERNKGGKYSFAA